MIERADVKTYPAIVAWIACTVGCVGSNAYLSSAGKYAKTTSEQATTLKSITSLRADLCHLQARYDFAVHFATGAVDEAGKPVDVLGYEDTFTGAGATWATQCTNANAAQDRIVDKALVAIGSYADALATVASMEFKGTEIGGLGRDASDALKSLDQPTAAKLATTLVDPIKTLATTLEQRYAAKSAAHVIKESSPAVTQLFKSLRQYVADLALQSKAARQSLLQAVALSNKLVIAKAALDKGATDRWIPPGDFLVTIDVATRWSDRLDHIDAAIAAATDSLDKLQAAQDQLLAANGDKDAPHLKTVIGDLSQVIGDIAAIRSALNGKDN